MATMPPEMTQPAMGAPMMDDAPMMDEPAGYEIHIRVSGDGSLSVGVEKPDMEGAVIEGEMAEVGEPASYKPAANIKEALTIALEIFKADGEMADEDAAQAAFQSGLEDSGGY